MKREKYEHIMHLNQLEKFTIVVVVGLLSPGCALIQFD